MTEPRQRRVGAYAKLLANYASDDAIIEAGEAAELLFVRGLAFCATSDSDGFITDSQVGRYVGAGMRDAAKRAKRLAEVGLWERVDGGYNVRSWLRIHESAEEKGRKKAQDRERKRQIKPPDFPPDSDRNPNGFHEQGSPESLLGTYVSSKQPTEQSNDKALQNTAGESSDTASDDAEPLSPFCKKHPNGTEKPCGPCATARTRYAAHVKATVERDAAEKAERRIAIDGCELCDDFGRRLSTEGAQIIGKCNHQRESA